MKKILLTLSAALLLASSAFADEGMWLLPLLQKMNSKTMTQLGCRLSADEIYSINHSSLKDAIVQFGGGCTGEIISNEGLLVTNHHCGYGSIQGLSTDEHNYLENGYWAMNRNEEIPVPNLTVTFLVSMTDVTEVLDKARNAALKQFKDSTNKEDLAQKVVTDLAGQLSAQSDKENPNTRATVQSFYNDNVFYLIVYKTFRDVRFVGAPPASVGKFGGETDNWMWPRHTGDFSMFRVYADKDNNPAAYSPDNVPYVPKQALKVSLRGFTEGDFAMIMGYPGSTQRFQTAVQLQDMIERHDVSIEARTLRQGIMWDAMEADPSVRLKYASKFANSANGWKKWQGEKLAFEKLGIIEKEQQKEADFTSWVNSNKKRKAKYGDAIAKINSSVEIAKEPSLDNLLLNETVGTIELVTFPMYALAGGRRGGRGGAAQRAPMSEEQTIQNAFRMLDRMYKNYDEQLDRKEAAALLKYYREKAKKENYLEIPGEDFATMDIDAYVDKLFSSSAFTSLDKVRALLEEGGMAALQKDPAFLLSQSIFGMSAKWYPQILASQAPLAEGNKAFTAGLLEWKKGEASYPDANFTMRLTYGTVQPYSPKDGVLYNYYTTHKGVLEKENPDDYEFKVPAELKKLMLAKDFGQYALPGGDLPSCFLTTNDITGGNSGSPVLDADGALIGLAFDGNWESMSSDVMFEPDLQRCICVDIRYVLFLVDKLGGAGYLLDEMDIVR